MKYLSVSIIALSVVMCASLAPAQKTMKHMPMQHGSMNDMMMKTMMMGLSPEEMKIAHEHMSHMSAAEKAVMMKRGSMCMKSSHKGMNMDKMNDKMAMAHMMSGLSMSEQKTMKNMWSKMSMKQMAVAKKMMMNCCMYGMKHVK